MRFAICPPEQFSFLQQGILHLLVVLAILELHRFEKLIDFTLRSFTSLPFASTIRASC
jgi:hypothetical protein